MTDDLVAFLREQLNREEQSLRAMNHAIGGVRSRWDPPRLLADIEAKRQIIEAYQNREETMPSWGAEDYPGGELAGLYQAIQRLALPYADRPAYRQEWRP